MFWAQLSASALFVKGFYKMQSISSSSTTDHEYNAIDIAKFVCALFVISIHFNPFAGGSAGSLFQYINFGIANYLAHLAVPFFFVCSGFFLFQKISLQSFSWVPIRKYVIRIFTLYVIWSVIYLPFSFYTNKGYLHAILVYIRNFIFVGSYNHLWYLNALIFSTLLVSLLLYQKISFKLLFTLSFAFYFVGLFAQSWFGFILPLRSICPLLWKFLLLSKKIIFTTRNGLFEGFIFISMGAYFAQSKKTFKKYQSLCGLLLSTLLLLLEIWILTRFKIARSYDMFLFLLPSAFFLFSLLSQIHLPDHPIFKELRLLSALIYYTHYWIGNVISRFLYLQDSPVLTSFLRFILIATISILCSHAILRLSRKPKFRFLKLLY